MPSLIRKAPQELGADTPIALTALGALAVCRRSTGTQLGAYWISSSCFECHAEHAVTASAAARTGLVLRDAAEGGGPAREALALPPDGHHQLAHGHLVQAVQQRRVPARPPGLGYRVAW